VDGDVAATLSAFVAAEKPGDESILLSFASALAALGHDLFRDEPHGKGEAEANDDDVIKHAQPRNSATSKTFTYQGVRRSVKASAMA
jgi:hypothetical protein